MLTYALINNNLYRKNAICKYLLVSIENQGKEKVETENLTIEHVLPQNSNLSSGWQKMLGDNWKEVRDKYLHTLGNLTLTAYNSEFSDKDFDEKKRMLADANSKVVVLYSSIKDCDVWNADSIENRAKVLADEVKKLFPIEQPTTAITFSNPNYQEYSCENPGQATSKTPNYYIFQGEKVLANSFADILASVIDFKPESRLNKTANAHYEENICNCIRQWHYSSQNKNSVDMVLVLNGIPVIALELKNQYTGQTVDNAKKQWMYDRDPREICFQFNKRILAYYCVDHTDVYMTTKLAKADTFFLPFNQGSNGAGNNGGAGNPPNPNGYPTAYLWENVLQKDSMLDILQKFLNLQTEEKQKKQADGTKKTVVTKKLIFPRYHQLDVVRKLIADVKENGAGKNYLIQHSAGSGKSNSIAWIAYRLAAVHDINDKPIFRSVIIVTDRTVLDRQLQNTISGFDHTIGTVETIGDDKTSKDLKNAINDGCRIIVTTLQKFPVIYEEVDDTKGRNFAVIVDEAHSSQTGQSATKLKAALADTEDALKEYAEIEGKSEDEIDKNDKLISEMLVHGRHKNLSFFAFTATPKDKTLEMFGTEYADGSFHPYHVYSMKQAIEEGFIMDVLQNNHLGFAAGRI